MRFRLWLAFVLLLGTFGCDSQKQFVGGKAASKLYRSAVSLSPSTTELGATTFKRHILGRTASCDMPPYISSVEVVMKGVKPDYERIAALKPDCVIYDDALFGESDIAKFKELGIETFAFGGDTLEAFIDRLYEFARYANEADAVSTYADKILRERELALADKQTPAVTAAVIIPGSGSEHMVAGTEGFTADVLRAGGTEPVGPAGKNFVPMNAEWLVSADPELLITAGPPDAILKDARFQTLRAVKAKHVFGTNPKVTLRRGGFVDSYVKRVGQLAHIVRQK